jgi:hypothetical protein
MAHGEIATISSSINSSAKNVTPSEVLLLSLTAQTPSGFDHRPTKKYGENRGRKVLVFRAPLRLTAGSEIAKLAAQRRRWVEIAMGHEPPREFTQLLQE